jgi:hypothetical protein
MYNIINAAKRDLVSSSRFRPTFQLLQFAALHFCFIKRFPTQRKYFFCHALPTRYLSTSVSCFQHYLELDSRTLTKFTKSIQQSPPRRSQNRNTRRVTQTLQAWIIACHGGSELRSFVQSRNVSSFAVATLQSCSDYNGSRERAHAEGWRREMPQILFISSVTLFCWCRSNILKDFLLAQ